MTLKKLYRLLSRVLEFPSRRGEDSPLLEEYFSCQWGTSYQELTGDDTWESLWRFKGRKFRWVAAFAVTGGSEGHYVHVELVAWERGGADAKRTTLPLFLGKTFQGYESACKAAALLGALLGA